MDSIIDVEHDVLPKSAPNKDDRLKELKKQQKGGIKIKKGRRMFPLGYEGNPEEDRLEKLVLGEKSGAFKEPAEDSAISEKEGFKSKKRRNNIQPAWLDQDQDQDNGTRVKAFETFNGKPEWAKLDGKRRTLLPDDEDDDEQVLKHAGNLLSRSTVKHASLVKGTLEYKKNLDLNSNSDSTGAITAIEFHPAAAVGLVADKSGYATLYEVNGKTNPKLQSIIFKNFLINCAKFATNGTEFLVGSQFDKHMYCYDMEAATSTRIVGLKNITNFKKFEVSPDGSLIAVVGRMGYIHLLDSNTKELVDTLKMNGEVKSIAFNLSGTRLYSHGDEGKIYVWDTNSRTCVENFYDEGCLSGMSLAACGQYLASGCSSGAVNIYTTQQERKPAKTLLNLLTTVTGLAFNASEEMVAMWSYIGENAIRLVHLPSYTVFSNFPGKLTDPMGAAMRGNVERVVFSPNGGYMAIGGSARQVSLIRLKHYGNY